MTEYQPLLPLDLELYDAKGLYESKYDSESLHIKYYNGKYHLESRYHSLAGVDWEYHFTVSRPIALQIVARGWANWWHTVDESRR